MSDPLMNNPKSISLTAAELGYLWTGYSINEMSKWYLTIFREHSKDMDMKALFSLALKDTSQMLNERRVFISREGYPIPVGFSTTDIYENSPPLFSDRFMVYYLHKATRLGLEFHSRSLALSTRDDIRKYQKDCLQSCAQLNDRLVDLLLTKGIYWRTPSLPAPTLPEDIQKNSYLNGWVGDIRPLNSMEIANFYSIMELLVMMETLFTGFAQTSESEEVVKLLQKGVTVVKKQLDALIEILKKNELPVPPSYVSEITDSKKRLFSDRIMICHMAGLFGALISQYGFSLGSVMKHDLLAAYSTQIGKAGIFSEKVTKFLIEKEWLEKVPGAITH
jgi:hypothetical protein